MSEWQPIETAPKDGTIVDLFYPYPRKRAVDCRWTDDLEIGWHWKSPRWENGTLLPEADWYTSTYPNLEPTHWMPAPKPPEQTPDQPYHQGAKHDQD